MDDARLEELALLSTIEWGGYGTSISWQGRDQHYQRMVVELATLGYLVDPGASIGSDPGADPDVWRASQQLRQESILWRLATRQSDGVILSHAGRVRLSELRQALTAGKIRDSFGILWDQRHLLTDLAVEPASASDKAPLAVAFFDVNGLKDRNDRKGHASGDQLLRDFFQAAISLAPLSFRNGGDEVVSILPATPLGKAADLARAVLRDLGRALATASCGLVQAPDPGESPVDLIVRADGEQATAKAFSKGRDPRPSVLKVQGVDLEVVASRPV